MGDWDNPNNGNDNWYSEEDMAPMPENINQQNTQQENHGNLNDDIKPVKLRKRYTSIILAIAGCIVFVVVVMSVGWFDGEKANNSDDFSSVEIQQQQTPNSGVNTVDKNSNFSENQTSSGGVGISSSGEDNTQEINRNEVAEPKENVEEPEKDVNVVNSGNLKSSSDLGLNKVEEPVLSELREVQAAVLSKNVYTLNRSYGYMIELVVSNNGSDIVLNYFCPRKTYDALSIGDAVKIQYQSDENGVISIASVSR